MQHVKGEHPTGDISSGASLCGAVHVCGAEKSSRILFARLTTKITHITSAAELHNRISVSRTHSLSHWLWSGGADVRGRQVAMEMGATVAFQEDGSWQNEAEQRRVK